MNNVKFKTEDAAEFIVKALNDFLRDKKLQLTNQQYEKLKKLLMVRLLEEEMSYNNAYNLLNEIIEYRKDYEINANAVGEAEEEIIRIIGAADNTEKEIYVETTKYKKPFIFMTALCALLIIGLIGTQILNYTQNQKTFMASVIGTDEEDAIKSLDQKVVTLESSDENIITHSAVYNDIKALKDIKSLGSATSYKKFNQAQYLLAVEYLNDRLQN